jgi:hypothetical protein
MSTSNGTGLARALWPLLACGLVACVQSAPRPSPPPAPSEAASNRDVRYFTEIAQVAVLAGGSPVELLASGAGIPGDSISAFVSIPAGRCALLAARGALRVADIDLYLFADDGDEIAKSDDVDHPATLLRCAEGKAERLLAVARIAAGHGPFALGLSDAPIEKRQALLNGALAGAENAEQLEDWPGLDAAVGAHRDLVGGAWRDLRRVIVPGDHRLPTQLDFDVERERCVDVLALPGAQVDDLELEALSSSGRVIARAEAHGTERALLLCAGADPAKVTLRLRPHAGRGAILVALSETTKTSGRHDLHPEFPRHDLSPAPGSLPQPRPSAKRLQLSVDDLVSSSLGWTGCQRVELDPAYPLLGYRLVAYDGEGRLIGEHEGTGPALLHLCLPRTGASPGRLDLRATVRAGPLDVHFAAEPASASATLERFPLAASRLLGLASDLGLLRRVSDIGQVSEHQLGPDQLVRIPLSVPVARCLTVLAAVDRSGPGIELALVSGRTARFSDFAHGRTVAWARVCADEGQTEEIVVELRAPHGAVPALVSTRQEVLTPAVLGPAGP